MKVEVRAVRTRPDLRAFVDLPWGVYRRDDNWVPQTHEKHPGWAIWEFDPQ